MIDKKILKSIAKKMKAKMSMQERMAFIENCTIADGDNFIESLYKDIPIYKSVSRFIANAFVWDDTEQKHDYWAEIADRF